ncbi:MAG: TRAP transporter fused permease subunit [Desulfovibrio sp.]|nr:TRAP transporter fused permease subunit [Desulfovibrio sp.]
MNTDRRVNTGIRRGVTAVAVVMSAYHVFTGYFGQPLAEMHRPLHLLLAFLVLCWAKFDYGASDSKRILIGNTVFTVAALFSCGYLIVEAAAVSERMLYVDTLTPVMAIGGVALILTILEATRRSLGWPLVIVCVLFLIYALFGNHLPYPFWHRGYSLESVIEQMYLTMDGIWSIPVQTCANFIFLFVLFGAFLAASGTGAFFSDFANSLSGRSVGGAAKTAVVSSALMSMLSGSSTANVVTTGSFTIPAMKKSGYPAHFAAGVEAVASTGGLITPPVMGAAAFIMAEFLGVSYGEIMKAAALPAILYYVAIYVAVDFEARRLRLIPDKTVQFPPMSQTLKRNGYLLLPVVILTVALLYGYTPAISAVWAIASLVTCTMVFDPVNRKRTHRIIWEAFSAAPKLIGPIVVACAVGGIIAGVIQLTGLGYRLSIILLSVSGDSLFVTLFLTVAVAVILGMGMPTSAIYIILAVILAPAMEKLGVPPLAAHLLIFYGAAMSNITPPLAMASFAAAAIANCDPWKTSFSAMRTGAVVFLVPFFFVYGPELIGIGSIGGIIHAFITACCGVSILAAGTVGWLLVPLSRPMRGLAFATGLLLIDSNVITDIIGAGTFAALLILVFFRYRAGRAQAGKDSAGSS